MIQSGCVSLPQARLAALQEKKLEISHSLENLRARSEAAQLMVATIALENKARKAAERKRTSRAMQIPLACVLAWRSRQARRKYPARGTVMVDVVVILGWSTAARQLRRFGRHTILRLLSGMGSCGA